MNTLLKTAGCLLLSISFAGEALATGIDETGVYRYDYPVIPETLSEDTYYDNGVLLRNITLPDDLGQEEGTISASFEGSGTLVVGDQKNGGYPRIVMPAGDVSVSYYYPGNVVAREYWDGRITPPKRTLRPKRSEVGFSVTGNHFGDIELENAYQIGLDSEDFTFPSGTALVFFLDVPDQTRVWYARQLLTDEEIENARTDDSDNGEFWTAEESDFCVIKNKLCIIENVATENKIVFFQESFTACPNLRVDNGYYAGAPHCNIKCESDYELDFSTYSCVKAGNGTKLGYEVDLSNRTDYNIDYKLRPGYFKYRDSRGSQLEQRNTEGLNGKDLDEVEYDNAVKSPRQNKNNAPNNENEKLDKIWAGLQNLDFQFWRSQNEVRPDPVLMMDDQAQTYEEKVENCENCEETESFGAILPRTGPAGFIGVALLGLLLVSLGLRRR